MKSILIDEKDCKQVFAYFLDNSAYFTFTPYPDGEYLFEFKDEGHLEALLATGSIKDKMELIQDSHAYKQAFEALAKYQYNLEKVQAGHYELMILADDVNEGALFNEYSSDFFTLMQYFYKWERGNYDSD